MELISVIISIIIAIFTLIYGYFKYSFRYWKSKGVLCDEPVIPYGHTKGMGKTVHLKDIVKKMYDKYKSAGAKFAGVYIITRPTLLLIDLELIKTLYVKDFHNFNERNMYYNENDPLTENLLMMDGDKWSKLRTKLTPTYSSAKMKFMFPTIVQVTERLRDCIFESIPQDDQMNIKDLMVRYLTDIIGTCAFGIECNSLTDPNSEFRHYTHQIVNAMPKVQKMYLLSSFKSIARKLNVKLVPADIDAFFTKVVRDTIDYRESNDIHRNDLMEIMIALKNRKPTDNEEPVTFNEIAAQAFIFYIAGFETSSSAITYCLYELAMNPDVQTKARQTVEEAYKKYDGQCTHEMLMDVPYIDQVFDETLRKYPPGTVISRTVKNDYRIKGTNVVVDKGTSIFIPIHAIHHDPEYYPNPEKFDPNRFTSEEKKKRNAICFIPFGDGPRNCIGMRFAIIQVRVALIILLKNFEFSIGSKTTVPLIHSSKTFLLTPESDVHLKVTPVKSS